MCSLAPTHLDSTATNFPWASANHKLIKITQTQENEACKRSKFHARKRKNSHCDWLTKGGYLATNRVPIKTFDVSLAWPWSKFVSLCFHFAKTESHSKEFCPCKCHRNRWKKQFTPDECLPNFYLKFDFLERPKMPLSQRDIRNRRQQREMKRFIGRTRFITFKWQSFLSYWSRVSSYIVVTSSNNLVRSLFYFLQQINK